MALQKNKIFFVPYLTWADGNKRLGAHVMLVFLALNGYELVYTQQELSGAILDLASGKMDADDILQWIISHQK